MVRYDFLKQGIKKMTQHIQKKIHSAAKAINAALAADEVSGDDSAKLAAHRDATKSTHEVLHAVCDHLGLDKGTLPPLPPAP
jgi:hypothetical protein